MKVLEIIRQRQTEIAQENQKETDKTKSQLQAEIDFFQPVREAINEMATAGITYLKDDSVTVFEPISDNARFFNLAHISCLYGASYGVTAMSTTRFDGKRVIVIKDDGGLNLKHSTNNCETFTDQNAAVYKLAQVLAAYIEFPTPNCSS